jgi:hypothetical protein
MIPLCALLLQMKLIIHLKLLTVAWRYASVLKQARSTSFTAYKVKIGKNTLVMRRN